MASSHQKRRCKAIIFDLDDTLVPTSAIDRGAVAAAAALAGTFDPGAVEAAGGEDALVDRFRALLKAEPFPPQSVSVASWRSALWARSIWPDVGDGGDGGGDSMTKLAVQHILSSLESDSVGGDRGDHSGLASGNNDEVEGDREDVNIAQKRARAALTVHDAWCAGRLRAFRFPKAVAG